MNKNKGNQWFSNYKFSVKSIKTHCYYAMKNCGGDAEKLRSQLRNIVEHYKVKFK